MAGFGRPLPLRQYNARPRLFPHRLQRIAFLCQAASDPAFVDYPNSTFGIGIVQRKRIRDKTRRHPKHKARLRVRAPAARDETINAELKITVKPILINKGKLRVSVACPNGDASPYTIFIDGTKTDADAGYTLSPGVHDINIVSDFYRDEMRTVRIDQAKTTELAITLKSLAPTLLVTSPDNAAVYVDGRKWTAFGKETEISEGEHTVRFVMGDYEIVRTLNAQKGKSYTASVAVDVKISEE